MDARPDEGSEGYLGEDGALLPAEPNGAAPSLVLGVPADEIPDILLADPPIPDALEPIIYVPTAPPIPDALEPVIYVPAAPFIPQTCEFSIMNSAYHFTHSFSQQSQDLMSSLRCFQESFQEENGT